MNHGRPFLTHGAGFLLNDNRNSGEGMIEADIGICPHCQKVINLQQWRVLGTNQRGWCMKCMLPCCGNGPCAEEYMRIGCVPFLKRIDNAIADEYAKQQFRRMAGLEPEQPSMFIGPGRT